MVARPHAKDLRGRPKRNLKYVFAAVGAGFLGLAIYTALLVAQQQSALREVSRYNLTWMVTQAALQLDRFTVTVDEFSRPGTEITAGDVSLGYDLVVNQVSLFDRGAPAAFVQSDPELHRLSRELRDAVRNAEPEVDRIGTPGAVERLLALLVPLNSKL